jgi:hypothetical protein
MKLPGTLPNWPSPASWWRPVVGYQVLNAAGVTDDFTFVPRQAARFEWMEGKEPPGVAAFPMRQVGT